MAAQRYDDDGAPAGAGTPTACLIEIYRFTSTVVWAEYESIRGGYFDLTFSLWSNSGRVRFTSHRTGNDIRSLAAANHG